MPVYIIMSCKKNHKALVSWSWTFSIIFWVARDSPQGVEIATNLAVFIMQSHAGVFGFTKESGLWAYRHITSDNQPIISKFTIIIHKNRIDPSVSSYLFQSFPILLIQDAGTG